MIQALRRLIEWGVRPETPPEEAHHYRITNSLLLLLLIGSILLTSTYFLVGAYQAGVVNSTAPLVFGGGLLLMRAGYTRLARLMVLTISFAGGQFVAMILGPASDFQIIILFAGALSFTFFPVSDRGSLLYGITLPIASFVSLELTHYQPMFGLERVQLSPEALGVTRLASVGIIWFLLVGQVAYLARARLRTRERLVVSAKLVALGQMAAGIAHEVNNPLLQIVGQADRLQSLAASGPVPADKALAFSERIQNIALRIGAIVHGLQSFSRDASADSFDAVPVHAMLQKTLDFSHARLEKQGVELKLGDIPQSWTVIGREAQLEEVVLNLLNNSIDAVETEASSGIRPWIRIEAQAREALIELAISDSGPGVPPGIRARIFDPFFTTKPVGKGTGLGLSISRGIVASHRGQLFLDESASETRFVIRIPRGSDTQARPHSSLSNTLG